MSEHRPDDDDPPRWIADEPSGETTDPMAPGRSVDDDRLDDPPDDAVEPNEPA